MERLQRALDLARLESLGQSSARAAGAPLALARFPVPQGNTASQAERPPHPASPRLTSDGAVADRDPADAISTDVASSDTAAAWMPNGSAAADSGIDPAASVRPLPPNVATLGERDAPASFPAVRAAISPPALRARHVVLPGDGGPAAHAYRMLRTQLLQRAASCRARTIGIVSAADGEGKTLTALNLALSIAADPERNVLLADLDLRRPALAKLLGLSPAKGLEAWFAPGDEVVSADALCLSLIGVPRLVIAPAFAPLPQSSEHLAGNRSRRLLQALQHLASPGPLLLDLPPALLGDDVLAIAPMLDAVVLVVSERRTRRDDFERVQQLLAGVPVLGTVLNASAESERRVY